MVEHNAVLLDKTFGALANPTRRSLLEQLAAGEATVTELAAPYRMSLAAVSKHLQVLEQAGLVERRVEGRQHHLSLAPASIEHAAGWLARYQRFWESSLAALAAMAADRE